MKYFIPTGEAMMMTHNLLTAALQQTQADALSRLAGANPDRVVHPGSGWTVKDVLAHVLAWELEILAGLEAHLEGRSHVLPAEDMFDAYNQRAYERYRPRSFAAVLHDWQDARQRLIAVVGSMPDDVASTPMVVPWEAGVRQPPTDIAAAAIPHAEEHLAEIYAGM